MLLRSDQIEVPRLFRTWAIAGALGKPALPWIAFVTAFAAAGLASVLSVEAVGREYVSEASFLGLPLLAVGEGGRGWVSFGTYAVGLVAFGSMSVGVVAIGAFAVGLVSFAAVAVGVVSVGGVAAGWLVEGGGALGWYAKGGVAFGKHVIGEKADGVRSALASGKPPGASS